MEEAMKNSEYFLLMANVFIATHLSKGWALFMWAVHMVAFCIFVYLEKS
jgi:hypothetical protein